MKKIEAIIRKSRFNEVKSELQKVGIEFFSFWDVRGVGKSRQERLYRGVVYDTSMIERTMITLVVRDKNLDKTIKAIRDSAWTGNIGDGKIFVFDIEQSIRIRTGETGDSSLYIIGEEE